MVFYTFVNSKGSKPDKKYAHSDNFFYTFVNSKGSKPLNAHSSTAMVFYTFVNSKGSKPSKGHISTSGFSILPPKQEKNTPRVPYIFCRAAISADRDGNSPRYIFLSKHENPKNQKAPNLHLATNLIP
jgi:hypothetical protein